MRLFIDDPSEPDDEPETIGQLYDRLPEGEWVEAYGLRVKRLPQPDDEAIAQGTDQQAPMESSVRACVICGKPSPNGPECSECDEREFRRWGS